MFPKLGISSLFIFLIWFFSGVCIAHTGNTDYYFKQISTEQGLSQSSVRCVLNDHMGVIWIGTRNGLNRFDQYELESYYHQDTPYSLPDNNINFIAEDSLYNIWIGTPKGLVTYNREKNDFIPIYYNDAPFSVYSFHATTDGIMFGGKGIFYIYEYATKLIRQIKFSNKTPQLEFNHIFDWTDHSFIVGSRYGGIFKFNKKDLSIQELALVPQKDITAIYADNRGYIWLSPYGRGLYCFDSRLKQVLHITQHNSDLSNDIILDIIERDGNMWLATDGGGINIYNPVSERIKVINEEVGNLYSIPEKSILCLYNDMDNNLWAGTIRGGLLRVKEVFIRTYKNVPPNIPFGLSNKVVISLYEAEDGILWIGTDGGGINSYDPKKKKITHYLETYPDKIVSITGYSETQLMVSIFDKGLYLFDKRTKKLTPFPLLDSETDTRECRAGSSVYLDRCSKNKILILGKRIYIYDLGTRLFSTIQTDDPTHQERLQKINAGDSVSYLMGQYHIVKLHCHTGELEILYDSRGTMSLEAAAFDGKDSIWIGTQDGLYLFNLVDKKLKKIDTNLFNGVSSLAYDNRGRIWIGAQNMLFCYMSHENRFIILGESDGAYLNELFQTTVYKSLGNTLYLGGASGLICINKGIVFKSDVLPIVQLSDVVINGVSRLNELTVNRGNKISVPWNTNSIEVKLSTKEKDIFRKKMFRYSIVGLNDQYIDSYNRTLSLVALPPGDYTIMVSCNSQSGVWSTPKDILHISVIPPIWKTGWFIGGCVFFTVVLTVLAVYLVIRKNKNQLKWQMKEHEKEVDEAKIRFLINISHELRTPLTLVYAPLKRILEKKEIKANELNQELTGIFKHVRQMKSIINMVLDVRRMEVGQEVLHLEKHQLNRWVRTIGDDFLNEFAVKKISLDYKFDNRILDVSFDSSKCEIALSNLLMNALKYSFSDTRVEVATVLLDNDMVRISVSDQGIGLKGVDGNKLFTRFYRADYDRNGTGIGLSYAKILVEMQGGRISASDNEEAGATFYFDLPYSDVPGLIDCQAKPYLNELLSPDEQMELEIDVFETNAFSVLVVEDEPDMNSFLKKILKDHFSDVYTATNGREALGMISGCMPDVIVSDVMMPRMNGFELCKTVKNSLDISHIPVVLLTARNDSDSHSLGYKVGADAYLAKPFDTELLLTVIKNVLRNREQVKQRYKTTAFLPTPQEITISNVDEQFLLKLNKLICDHLDDPALDVKFITDNMAISRSGLYNKIKALTDMGVNDYINKFRIEKAVELLSNTDLSIMEISERTGFSYQRYFSSVFKQMKGITPTAFRQEKQNSRSKDPV